jgi:hypothetical protein
MGEFLLGIWRRGCDWARSGFSKPAGHQSASLTGPAQCLKTWGHQQKFWQYSGNGLIMKKACYLFNSRLSICRKAYLVGCAGVEPTTNGLKVRCSTN